MRALVVVIGLLALAVLAGCDSTQPLQAGGQSVQLTFSGSGPAPLYDVSALFEDTNPQDGIPDDVTGDGVADVGLWCRGTGISQGVNNVPWRYSARLRVLKKDTVQPIDISPPGASKANGGLTPYDTTVYPGAGGDFSQSVTHPRGACFSNVAGTFLPVRCNPSNVAAGGQDFCAATGIGNTCFPVGVCTINSTLDCSPPFKNCPAGDTCITPAPPVTRNFSFIGAARLSRANRTVLLATQANIFSLTDFTAATALDPPISGNPDFPGRGACLGGDQGEPLLAGTTYPIEIDLAPGDILTVEAQPSNNPLPIQLLTPGSFASLKATLLDNGEPVVIDPSDGAVTDGIDTAINFTFTALGEAP